MVVGGSGSYGSHSDAAALLPILLYCCCYPVFVVAAVAVTVVDGVNVNSNRKRSTNSTRNVDSKSDSISKTNSKIVQFALVPSMRYRQD